MVALTQTIPPSPQSKFPKDTWRWDYNPTRQRWETYRIPMDWPVGLYGWLFENFGNNLGMDSDSTWDYSGGWIYFYEEKNVTAFQLRWMK